MSLISKLFGSLAETGRAGQAVERMMQSGSNDIGDFFFDPPAPEVNMEAVMHPRGYLLGAMETLGDGTRRPLEVMTYSGNEILERWRIVYASGSGWPVREVSDIDQMYAMMGHEPKARNSPSFTLRRLEQVPEVTRPAQQKPNPVVDGDIKHVPEVTSPAVQKPNLVLDDNMELRPEMGFMHIVGTVTNGGTTSIDGGILITFSLFDAQKNPMGTASDYLCKGSTVAPGVSWRYDCVCMRNDAEKVVKATLKNLAIE